MRPLRTFSIEKARNLFRNAQTALKDAKAPAEFVSEGRRFDAAYDCGLTCALLVLECNKQEISGPGHHQDALEVPGQDPGTQGADGRGDTGHGASQEQRSL